MKPVHIKRQRQKEIRGLLHRRREIWVEKDELGYIKLKNPIRHCWFKEIVITRRVTRYKNEASILELYDVIEKSFWGRTKEEAERKWLFQTSKYMINKEIPTISKRQFNRLSEGAKRLCVPFQYYTERKKLRVRFYVNIPRGTYRIKFTRAYITHSKRIDPLLESEYALIEQQLLKRGYYEAEKSVNPWKYWWYWPNYRENKKEVKEKLSALKKFPLREIINEELSWERN